MSKRLPNPRLAKGHRNYTVAEVSRLFDVHKNTVREWIKRGLPTNDMRRPFLILGRDLSVFLAERRSRNKRTCQLGEMYCLRCRAPRAPAAGMVDYTPTTATIGNLVAICSSCETLMHRRASLAKLDQFTGHLDITLPHAPPRIGEMPGPFVNSDFK